MKKNLFILVLFIIFSSYIPIDYYPTIRIGRQHWMIKNLDVDCFKNGDPIRHAISQEDWEECIHKGTPAWCYYENNAENEYKYGKLYNWFAVHDQRGLAPKGFHIPNDEEWSDFKSKYTSISNPSLGLQDSLLGTKGGFRSHNGTFYHIEEFGYYWSTPDATMFSAWIRNNYGQINFVFKENLNTNDGLSVRCIRD